MLCSLCRTVPAREGDGQPVSRRPDLSPDGSCSPLSAVPQALDFSPEKSDFTFSQSFTTEVTLDGEQPPEAAAPSEVRAQVGPPCAGLGPAGDQRHRLWPRAPAGRREAVGPPPLDGEQSPEAAAPSEVRGAGGADACGPAPCR